MKINLKIANFYNSNQNMTMLKNKYFYIRNKTKIQAYKLYNIVCKIGIQTNVISILYTYRFL